jgi:hypothetical protein
MALPVTGCGPETGVGHRMAPTAWGGTSGSTDVMGLGGGRRPAAVRRDGAGGAETDSGGAEGHSGPARWGRPVAVVVQQAAAARRTVAARD